jgi:hypothetical protein
LCLLCKATCYFTRQNDAHSSFRGKKSIMTHVFFQIKDMNKT